ncbi:MAG: hypothetical protein ACPIOQ_81440, partial [Promethearchaeia archaeon]
MKTQQPNYKGSPATAQLGCSTLHTPWVWHRPKLSHRRVTSHGLPRLPTATRLPETPLPSSAKLPVSAPNIHHLDDSGRPTSRARGSLWGGLWPESRYRGGTVEETKEKRDTTSPTPTHTLGDSFVPPALPAQEQGVVLFLLMSPRLVAAGLLAAALLFCGALAVAKTGGVSVAETAALARKPAATVVAQKLSGPALPTVAKLAEGEADAATE